VSVDTPPMGVSGASFASLSFRGQRLQLQYQWLSPANFGPLIVFLHEGLGSLTAWRDFPHVLCDQTGCRGLIYSRCGYGDSSPLWPGPAWPQEFMHVEATEILPRLLAALNIDAARERPVLLGHSDGGSIALIYAGTWPKNASKLIVLAPHLFVEPLTQSSIKRTRDNYTHAQLRDRLARYHRNVDGMFAGWSGAWLAPGFARWDIQAIASQRQCPTLAIQGCDDEYGTMRQIESLATWSATLRLEKIPDCGHAPHLQAPATVLAAIGEFMDESS
jgi:pimeloyl-ACP methyl ester carboxylesterase